MNEKVFKNKTLYALKYPYLDAYPSILTLFYRQLHFRSHPGSCLPILANGVETEITLPAKICLNDSSQSELLFGTKTSIRNQLF